MIKTQFKLGSELFDVVIKGNELLFMDIGTGAITTIEGIKLSRVGVLKEHPDLENESEWKKIAIKRLKEHMNSFRIEMDKAIYIKDELIKFGYEVMHYQKAGFRPQKFK